MREYLKLSEVCEILGAGRKTVLNWIHEGKLKAVKLGGGRLWRVRERDLQAFIRSPKA